MTSITWIRDLANERYAVLRDIPVTIESFGDEVVARWHDVELFGSADNEADAINELKNQIVELFEELSIEDDKKLGKLPLSWKRVLTSSIRQIG